MPTYEYACPTCKTNYELRQGFDAETTHACEECGKGVAKRILHAPRVIFKGGGWYATDSRKSQSAVSESSESTGGSSDSSDSGDSGDSGESSTTPATEPAPKAPAPKKSPAKDGGASTEAAAAG